METNKIGRAFTPGLIVNITDDCNFKCQYCPPFGENLDRGEITYDEKSVICLIEFAKKYGVQQVRFTGGEPFYEPKRLKIFLDACSNSFRRLVVNTNASLLHNNFDWLVGYKDQFVLKISLDTLDESNFNRITQKSFYCDVYENLVTAISMSFNIEINAVLFNQSFEEILQLVDFVVKSKINLKFLTTSSYYGHVVSFNSVADIPRLTDYLSRRSKHTSRERLVGERGAPMLTYQIETSKITLFDHRIHDCLTPQKCYFSKCETECSQYPCDHGAFSITISTDGLLSICRGRKDLGELIFGRTPDQIENAFLNGLKQFNNCFDINVNTL